MPACLQAPAEAEVFVCTGACSYPFDESRKDAFRQHIGSIMQLAETEPGTAIGNGSDLGDADGGSRQQESSSGVERLGHPVCVVCRRGNDSQHVVQMLKEHGLITAVDLLGGLEAWSRHANVDFPEY